MTVGEELGTVLGQAVVGWLVGITLGKWEGCVEGLRLGFDVIG